MSQLLKWRIVFTGILSLVMSGLVSTFVTLVNVGLDPSFFIRVLKAWATAFPFAWATALLWAPTARKIAAKIVTPPPGA